MIRIKIDRPNGIQNPFSEENWTGLIWYENGSAVGTVIIEKQVDTDTDSPYWVPVDVVDE